MSSTDRVSPGRRGWLGPLIGVAVLGAVALLFGLRPATLDHTLGKPAAPITRFLIAVAVILLVCHLIGGLFRRFGHPAVLGEIVGGLLLGPSVFGQFAPTARDWLFPADILAILDNAAQLGLIVFLFLLGCELNLGAIRRKRVVGATVAGGVGLPFLAGLGVALYAGPAIAAGSSTVSHVLFIGLDMSITALPVLARILIDLRLDRGEVGVFALTCAAVGDAVTWLVLAVILAFAGADDGGQLLPRLGLAIAFLLVMALCVRPVLVALIRRSRSDHALMAGLVIGAVAAAALAQQIDLHPMIGAFLFGALVPPTDAVARGREQLEGFTITILLPLFFAGVGLRTSVGLIGGDPSHWLLFAVFLLAAVSSKMLGAGGGARLAGLPKRQAFQLGALMNCRGITELVVATVGLQYGLINDYGFTVLVLVGVIASLLTGALMRRSVRLDAAAAAGSDPGSGRYGRPGGAAGSPGAPAPPPRTGPPR